MPAIPFMRAYPLENIEIMRTGDGRTVEAYAAVFNQPAEIFDQHGHYMESIAPTAFNKTLAERGDQVGVYYHHGMTLHGTPSDMGSVPLGSPVSIKVESRGLLTVTRYNASPLADSVLAAIRNGDIKGQSFSGKIYQSNPKMVPRRKMGQPIPHVTRTELGLVEYGPTPRPAYVGAEIMAVRSAEDIEAALADMPEGERTELLNRLTSTAGQPGVSSTESHDSAGVDESPGRHSVRQEDLARRIAAARVRRGIGRS